MKYAPSHLQRRSRLRAHDRRGVLLLMILSLLVLFVLVGMTFILTASQFKRASSMRSRSDRYGDAPQQLAEMAIHQILRDTSQPGSAVYGHSLLRDVYGTDGFRATVGVRTQAPVLARPTPRLGGQQLVINVLPTGWESFDADQNSDSASEPQNRKVYDLADPDNWRALRDTNKDGMVDEDLDGDGVFDPDPAGPDMPNTTPINTALDSDNDGVLDTVAAFVSGASMGTDANGNNILDTAEMKGTSFYNGGLLTFTTGPAAGLSARIMLYTLNADSSLTIALETEGPLAAIAQTTPVDLVGNNFVVNGRALNGTGPGFDPVFGNNLSRRLEFTSPTSLAALFPNHTQMHYEANRLLAAGNPTAAGLLPTTAWIGGMDEAYDIADYQNLFLGWVPSSIARQRFDSPVNPTLPMGPANRRDTTHIIPSFHRPSVIHYFRNNLSADGVNYPAWASLRPRGPQRGPQFNAAGLPVTPGFAHANGIDQDYMLEPHPFFNGGVPFDPVYGPWDVDNDGNGIADSIWVDLGVPAQLNAQGKLVKPLFAVMCVDLDGRVNVNAAGTLTETTDDAAVVYGEGYGPPETRLSALFNTADVGTLLGERYGDGEAGLAGVNDDGFDQNGTRNQLLYKRLHWQSEYSTNDATPYSNPLDPSGRGVWRLDENGQPMAVPVDAAGNNIQTDKGPNDTTQTDTGLTRLAVANAYNSDPFEINMNSPVGSDTLFGVADLERHLRQYDADGFDLSQRIPVPTNIDDTNSITTHSFEISAPSFIPPRQSRAIGGNQGLLDLIGERFPALPAADIPTMFPYEMLFGQKMNLNRMFGDAVDNNGNGIVDEPSELAAAAFSGMPTRNDLGNNVIPAAGDPGGAPEDMPIRQMYARHLYCLAWLLIDDPDLDNNGTVTPVERDATADMLAQWAVNIVDFRDGDSIMTPFEYDKNVFDGWQVNGDVADGSSGFLADGVTPETAGTHGLVWGCERPELLITETIAWHDRRTKDDNMGGGDIAGGDGDLDQMVRPVGSFFVELYNPWSNQIDRKPRELYSDVDPTTGNNVPLGIGLGRKVDPTEGVDSSPVWRLNVTPSGVNPDTTTDPGHRMVYFVPENDLPDGSLATLVDRNGAPLDFRTGIEFYCMDTATPGDPAALRAGRIVPGGHAIVGSSGVLDGNDHVSIVAAPGSGPTPEADPPTTHQRIILNGRRQRLDTRLYAAGDPKATVPGGVGGPQTPTGTVPIGFPRSLSVSEPYDNPPVAAPEGTPRDQVAGAPTLDLQDGNHEGFEVVHLQRLADPTREWDAVTNPYRTIDSAHIALTIFNSQDTVADPSTGTNPSTPDKGIHSCQRGDDAQGKGGADFLYRMHPADGSTPAATLAASLANATLGTRNSGFPTWRTAIPPVPVPNPLPAGTNFLPWMNWNNRPYISQYELLNVPRVNSFQLPRTFGGYDSNNVTRGFPHLAKLTSLAKVTGGLVTGGNIGLERILDFVHVPSRFMGTEKWYSNTAFSSATADTDADYFRLGSNSLSRFRDPGKVNLNTIPHSSVWRALSGSFGSTYGGSGTAADAYWQNNIESSIRVGNYTPTVGNAAPTTASHLDPAIPTQFPRPFRPTASADLGPVAAMQDGTGRSGLLRLDASGIPLFFAGSIGAPEQDPLRNSYFLHRGIQRLANMTTNQSNVYAIWITVGYFEVEPWLTADANGDGIPDDRNGDGTADYVDVASGGQPTVDPLHPDGYMLGSEAGADTGQIKRHRSFYIIDRSIPVAFEPGRNHNVDDTILLRRHLE